ncbi:MAG: hypothetical protein ABSG83_20275, partial [Roseiarcus sp.]
AAGYIAGATRFKEVWDGSFRKADEGGRLTPRDLVEMHAAGLGLVWATHTIDLRATFADGAEIRGIQDLGLPQLRRADATSGEALSGVKVKISDGYFLIGLTRSDADAAHNLGLLATRAWFDFPMLLTDERIAKLTFEKGDTGDRVMAQALDAWK